MTYYKQRKAVAREQRKVNEMFLAYATMSALISAITAYGVAVVCFKKIDEYVEDIFGKLKDISEFIK